MPPLSGVVARHHRGKRQFSGHGEQLPRAYSPTVSPRRARILLAVYLVALAALTLVPVLGPDVTALVVRLAHLLGASGAARTSALVDATTNVLLFVPAGLLLGAAVPRLRPVSVWLVCVAASVGIELAQALVVPGRHPSAVDVATNALGAALGVLLGTLLRRSVRS
jgi:VanZ family protein